MNFQRQQKMYQWMYRGVFFSPEDYQNAQSTYQFVELQLEAGQTPDREPLRNYCRINQLERLGGVRKPLGDKIRGVVSDIRFALFPRDYNKSFMR